VTQTLTRPIRIDMTDPAVAAPPPGHALRGDAPANGDAAAATWGRASLEAALDNALKGSESLQPPQSGAAAPAPGLPTRGDGMLEKRISAAEIQLVQNLVERCFQVRFHQRPPPWEGRLRLLTRHGVNATR